MIELVAEKILDAKSLIPAHNKIAPSIKGVESWRLVHDGEQVVAFFSSAGDTRTMHQVFEAATEQECLDEVKRLGLEELDLKV